MDPRDPRRIAYEQQQWLRHDWHRFCTPDDARRVGLVHPDTRKAERRRAWEAEAQAARADAQFKADQAEILRLRLCMADLRFERALIGLCRKYSPDQPRVPAGTPTGGRWTQVAQGDPLEGFPIDLRTNAHVLEEHVKSRNYVLARAQDMALSARRKGDQFEGLSLAGSFSSLESATKLVSSTLAQNRNIVDQVREGTSDRERVEARFSAPTGYEAYVRNTTSQPELRDTYGVRVVIEHDALSSTGYRIVTAYPIR